MKSKKFPGLGRLLRKNFFAGILLFTPIAVTTWLLMSMVEWAWHKVWSIYLILPIPNKPEGEVALWLNIIIFLGVVIVVSILISLLGWASKFYLGEQALKYLRKLIQRIPVLGTIYGSLDQLLRTLATGSGQQFNRVVYIEYPRKGTWAVAFVTGPANTTLSGGPYLNVFVPTVPNPTSGFHLLVPEKDVIDTKMKVEEAFKLILSLGIAQKDER